VPEVGIPGGSVDYFLVSAVGNKVKDFVGIELQTLDTTGTIWPVRQRFLEQQGIEVNPDDVNSTKRFGMNWKMTAKTTLVQLHHEVETFEGISKRLVLILQNHLFQYMRHEFQFEHIKKARLGDSMHIHSYAFSQTVDGVFRIDLESRYSTDSNGIAKSLGLSASPVVKLQEIIALLEDKISMETQLVLW
jgi:hypothetical protein